MPRIFISYRRADSQDYTERIHDRLVQAFGKENVFLDVDDGYIPSGSDFATVLREAVRKCDVLLVIMGPDWLDIRESANHDLRRLDNPEDFVRIEVETGLQNASTLVIPVLVKDAQPPSASELPESIRDLAKIQVERVRRNPDFHKDLVGLIKLIQQNFPNRNKLYFGVAATTITLLVILGIVLAASRGLGGNTVPTNSPEPATAVILLITERAGETLTAVAPTLTNTPNLTQTIDALVTQYFITETANAVETVTAYTDTPSPTFTPTITPSPTDDLNATATTTALTQIAIQQATSTQLALNAENTRASQKAIDDQATLNAQATANVPTNTPLPTLTPTPLPTATHTQTLTPTHTLIPTFSPTPTLTLPPTIDLTGTANVALTQTQVAYNNATQAVLAAQNVLNAQGTATQIAQATSAAKVTPTSLANISAKNGFLPITGANITLGYGVPGGGGVCGNFSPDGTLIATYKGLYEVATGKKRFAMPSDYNYGSVFSPDGKLLAIAKDGLYEIATGNKRFTFSSDDPTFSPDGSLLATNNGVYEVATGNKRFSFSNSVFSPDGSLLATNDGVYEVATGNKRFAFAKSNYPLPVFSSDGTLLAIANNGLYEVATGNKRFAISNSEYPPVFSPDGSLLAIAKDGLYETATGNKRFSISSYYPVFSPDGTMLALGFDGLYEVATGNKRFSISDEYQVFSPDGTLLALAKGGVYDVATGQKRFTIAGDYPSPNFSPDGTLIGASTDYACTLYGIPNNNWPIRMGLIHAIKVNIRRSPVTSADLLTSIQDSYLVVTARTVNNDWYQVDYGEGTGWVASSIVEIVSMPDDLPVVTP